MAGIARKTGTPFPITRTAVTHFTVTLGTAASLKRILKKIKVKKSNQKRKWKKRNVIRADKIVK